MKRLSLFVMLSISLFVSLLWVNHAPAVPAYPYPVKFKQSDGTTIKIIMMGDEKVKWAKTLDDYTVMYNKSGDLEYAVLDQKGDMILSGVPVKDKVARSPAETNFLKTLQKGLFYSESQVSIMKQIWDMRIFESQKTFPTTGNRKLICLLIGFQDKAFTKTKTDFQNLLNQVGYISGGANGSVKDYYLENSWTHFNLTVDVAGPYTASQNMSYYGANDIYGNDVRPRELVTEAINFADSSVNFANYDNDGNGTVDGVYVIYAGYGEEAGGGANCIWAHAWSITPVTKDGKTISRYSCSSELRGNSGTTISAIGVICHEFGHVLGAPDFYDTNYSTGGQFLGTGQWDMMAGGSWNNNGVTPAHHNAFTKIYFYEWAAATTLSSGTNVTIQNAAEYKSFYRIDTTTSGEYFLIENREKHKFDAYIPDSGMIIYHVHANVMSSASSNNINTTHPQRMYPKCASATTNPSSTPSSYGSINSAGCPWPGTSNKTSFTDTTTPNMKSWAGANTGKPISNITRNATNKTVSFVFMTSTNVVGTPSSITVPSSDSDGSYSISWGTSSTSSVTYVLEEATNLSFSSGLRTAYSGSSTSTAITGRSNGLTYYYRVKATRSGYTDSAWRVGSNGCVVSVTPIGNIGEALDNTSLTWTTGGNANWYGQNSIYYYGGDAAQSGDVSNSESTWVQATVSGPTTLTFYWKVSSETSYDYLKFYINGSEQTSISGSVDWQEKSYSIPSGSNTIKWAYTKDSSISSGSDAGWVDKVEVGASIGIGQAVDNTALTWDSGGNANWYGQNSTHYYDGDAAQSGAITHNGTSWVQTTMTGPGTLSYYWKVSSEVNYDYLSFYIDAAEQAQISGNADWQQRSYTIGSGSHTLKWTYMKDESVSSGSDAGWLDRVVFNTPTCPDCPADGVITNATYPAGKTCSCSNATSITLGSNVTVESGAIVTFTAPRVTVQPGFHAENGSTVRIKQ